MRKIEVNAPQKSCNVHEIELDIQRALKDHFKKDMPALSQRINPDSGGKNLEEWGKSFSLKVRKGHIQEIHRGSKKDSWKHLATEETAHFLEEVDVYLTSKRDKNYNPSFVTELLTQLQKNIDEFKCDIFRFTNDYKIELAVTACGYALKKFKEMAVRYRDENDAVNSLRKEKHQYLQDFKDVYQNTAEEIIAARQCCEILRTATEERVIKSLCLKVVQKMEEDELNSFLFTKPKLIKNMLVQIGSDLQKGDFCSCSEYLRHPDKALRNYIERVTENYCNDGHPQSKLTMYARELLSENMTFIHGVLSAMGRKACKLSDWIGEFKNKLSRRFIIHGNIRCTRSLSVSHNEHFESELKNGLDRMERSLRERFVMKVKDVQWDRKPYEVIHERVIGCTAACPFCREPCNKTTSNHYGDHTVNLHRPECLGGWRIRSTNKMCLSTCTESVANNQLFYVRPDSDRTHPFRRCEEIYPNWHIQEDLPGETSLYWKYVVAHFKSELAKLYAMKEDSVPSHWMGFELTQAIEAL